MTLIKKLLLFGGAIHLAGEVTRECPALVVDTSLSGACVARELDQIIALRGKPLTIVSHNSTKLQRHMTTLDDSPCRQADVFPTCSAPQNAGARLEAEWLADNAAPRAGKPIASANIFKIGGARCVVRENALELRQRPGERQIATGENVDGQDCI